MLQSLLEILNIRGSEMHASTQKTGSRALVLVVSLANARGKGRCAMSMRPFPLMTLALVALIMVGCSLGGGGTAASQKKPPEGTFELPSGHSLYMECRGSGSPTIVLEGGIDEPRSDMSYVQDTLARKYMTCTYDRANNGESGEAPTPRTAGEIVDDLHQL